jgi:hypothetical protein
MISKDEALENAVNIVYQTLFGLSRDDMLAAARQHPHFALGAGLAYAFGDEDEAMRDCFSEQALTVLSEAEGKLAEHYTHFMLVSAPSLEAALNSFNRNIREVCESVKAKHGDFPIWYTEPPYPADGIPF